MSDMFDRAIIDKLSDLKQRVADLTAQESIKLSSTGLPYFPALTAGSVLFAGSGGLLSQDNANFFWDDTNNRLGVGTAAPSSPLHVVGAALITGTLTLSNGTIRPGSLLDISGTGAGATTSIELGAGASGNRYCYIDFHGDDTYTDYGLRIIRNNGGANTTTSLQHRGTGNFTFEAIDTAHIISSIAGNAVMDLYPSGNMVLRGSLFPGNQGTYYIGWDGGASIYTNGNFRAAGHLYPDNGGTYYFGLSGSNTYTNTNLVSSGRFYPANQTTYGVTSANFGIYADGNLTVGGAATGPSGGAGQLSIGNTLINWTPIARCINS